MAMNNISMSDINEQFISDLAVNYIMDCFKYSYIDTAGDESSTLDINIDSPRKGLIAFDNNIRDAGNMTDITFYYRNPNGDIINAFKISQLSQLFEFNQQLTNRLFIDLYDITDTINCKFNFFNSQSFVLRQFHKSNFIPFTMDNFSTKFSDVLSFTNTAYNEYNNQIPLELRNFIKINPTNIVLDYKGKFYSNNQNEIVETDSIFNNEKLTIIPNIDYDRINQYNNEEYIIMSTFTIPILGQGIPELDYEDSRETYILLSTGLEGGLNPSREFKAIKVDNFVNQFKNVITIWDNSQSYVAGDTVKSSTNNKMYVCILNHTNQNPIYMLKDMTLINRDAGKYWLSYPISDIGTKKLLEIGVEGIDLLFKEIYIDDHILVGSSNFGINSYPDTWSYSNSLLTYGWSNKSGSVDGGATENRRIPYWTDNNNVGRYPRMINRDNPDEGVGLLMREHAIANNTTMTLPRIHGALLGADVEFSNATGIFYTQDRAGYGTSGRSTWNSVPKDILIDTHRVEAYKNTGNPSGGNIADRNRGNEIDYYTVIKVR